MTTYMPPEPAEHNQQTLEEWAGSHYVSLALVFTDIVKSTEVGVKLGDARWIKDSNSNTDVIDTGVVFKINCKTYCITGGSECYH